MDFASFIDALSAFGDFFGGAGDFLSAFTSIADSIATLNDLGGSEA